MPYALPTFPLKINIWTGSTTPPVGSPRVVDAKANLAWGKRVSGMSTGGTSAPGIIVATMQLLLEATTDIRGSHATTQGDTLEIPSGSGRYYSTWVADYVGLGFANCHKCAIIFQSYGFKTPDV